MMGDTRARATMRVALVSGAVMVVSMLASGVGPVAAQDDAACDPAAGGKTYGYISPGPDTWYQRDVDGFVYAAEADGNEVVVLNTEYDPEKEIANIESLINQGVDGISMFSSTEAGATLAAKRGEEAGIPVVLTDSVGTVIANGQNHVASVDFDWYGMGVAYADWMAENYPGERFVVLTGFFDSPPSQKINQGMTERAEELGVNELVTIEETKYSPDTAVSLAQDLINSGEEFGLLFVMDEDMSTAVIRMLSNDGYLDNPIKVFAQNGSPAGIPLLEEGSLKYTISSSPGLGGLRGLPRPQQLRPGLQRRDEPADHAAGHPGHPGERRQTRCRSCPGSPRDVYWDITKQYLPDLLAGRE